MSKARLINVGPPVPPLAPRLPRERGEGGIEALSSYITGHAVERSCAPFALFSNVFIPAEERLHERWARVRFGESHLINGYTDIATTVVSAVESCARMPRARAMTLLGLERLCDLKAKHLVHKTRPWCPDCYLEARAQGIEAWDPLYSYLRTTEVCVWHKTVLLLCCKQCGRGQRYLPKFPFLDRCEHCGTDLAMQRQPAAPEDQPLEDERLWAARAATDLIVALRRDQDLAVRHFVANLSMLADHYFDGLASPLANRLGLASASLQNWLRRGNAPTWASLLDLGYRLDIPPAQLGSAEPALTDPQYWRRRPPLCLDRRHIRASEDLLNRAQSELKEEPRLLESRNGFTLEGLGRLAKRLQTDTSMLKRHFPTECKTYIATRRELLLALNERADQARMARLKAAVQAVTAMGLPLTIRNLKQTGLLKVSDILSVAG